MWPNYSVVLDINISLDINKLYQSFLVLSMLLILNIFNTNVS